MTEDLVIVQMNCICWILCVRGRNQRIHAYDEMYVEGAMIHMGDMIEYACPDCRYAPDGFWRMFLQNEVVRRFEIGDESVVAGKSGSELAIRGFGGDREERNDRY